MKIPACFLGVLLLVTADSLAQAEDTLEQELQKCRDALSAGRRSEAVNGFDNLLRRKDTTDSTWEQVIRLQMEGGILDGAARNAETLVQRSALTPPKAVHQRLLQEVIALHGKEMDRVLSMKTWADAGLPADDFYTGLAKVLRRGVQADPVKADRAFRHVHAILQQSQEEENYRQAGRNASSDAPSARFLAQLGCAPGLMKSVWKIADATALTQNRDWCSDYVSRMDDSDLLREPGYALAIFSGTPFVAEAGEFRDIMMPGFSEGTMLGELTMMLSQSSQSDLKQQILRSLAARKPRTFGVELVECLLTDEYQDNNKRLKLFLDRRKADLSKLGDQAASTLMALLAARFYALTSPAPLDAELAALVAPLHEPETWYLDSIRFGWQKVAKVDDLKLDPESAKAIAAYVFERLVVRDQKQALQFLTQTIKLFRTEDENQSSRIAQGVLQEAAKVPETLSEVLKMAAREGFTQEGDWLQATLTRAWRPGDHVEQPQRMLIFLDATGVLGNAHEFAAGWKTGEPHEKGFVKRILSTFSGRPSAAKVFLPLLESRQKRSFGADVLTALMKPGSDVTLIEVAGRYRVELVALPADLQEEMVRFLSLWVRDLGALSKATPGFGQELQGMQKDRAGEAVAEVDKLLAAPSLQVLLKNSQGEIQELQMSMGRPTPLMTRMAKSLAEAHSADPGKAASGFKRFTGMIRSETRGGPPSSMQLQHGGLGGWLLVCLDHPALVPMVRETVVSLSPNSDVFWMQKAEEKLLPPEAFADGGSAVLLMERLGFLGAAEALDPQSWGGGRTQLEMMGRRIRTMPGAAKIQAAEMLRARQPVTLGSILMAALCQNTSNQAAPILDLALADLEKLSPQKKQAVCQMLSIQFGLLFRPGAPPPTGQAFAMLLNHEKMIEKEYLVSLTIPGAKFPAVLPLRGTSQVAGEELESLLESNDRIKSAALFDALMRTTGIPRPSQPHEAAVFRTSTTGMQSRFQSLLGMRKSARMAGLILSRINSDDKGQMGVPGTSFSAMIGSSLAASWQDEGGWVEPVPVFKTVLAELALGLGDTPPAAAAAALGDFLKLVPGPCRKEILQWAATCEAGSPVHGLAQEMTTVWTLMEKVKTGTGNIGNATEWQHYEQLMGKEGLGAQMQFGLVAWWCQSARNDVPASMVVPATQIAARLWSRGDNVNLVDMVALLESFSSLPESPQWREAASDFAREWEKKTLAMRNGRTTFLQPDAWHASMAVLARLKDEVLLDMMFETYKSSVNRELWAVGLLARQGMPSYAARLLRENWATMTSIGSPSSVEVTCGSLPAPEVLEAFTRCFSSDEPDLALLGRYAMLAECKPRDGAAMVGWDQAMEGLAVDSVATPVKNAALRRVIHGLIVRASPPLQSKLADSLARDAAASLAELGRYQPSSPEAWPVELLAVDGAVKAVAGDPTVVSRNLEMIAVALRKDQPSNTWYRSSASGMYLLRLLECLAPSWTKLSEEHRAAVLQAMADELPGAGLASAGSGSDLEAVKWILDCWSSVSGKTSVQSNASSASSRVSGPSLVRVKSILFQMTGSGDARLSEELRLKLLAAMLVKPEVQNELTMAASSIPKLVESYPLVSKEELVKSAASSLAPSMRRGGRSCHELAVLAFHQGNEAEALRLLELAEAEPQAQPGGGEFRYAERPVRTGPAPVMIVPTTTGRLSWSRESIYVTRAALLLRANRVADAKTLVEKIADGNLAPGKPALMKLVEERSAAPKP